MTGPVTPLALSRKIELTERILTARNQSLFLIILKKENFVRSIDLKIDDIWGLDLSMTGRAHAFSARRPDRDGVYNPVPNVLILPLSLNHTRNLRTR